MLVHNTTAQDSDDDINRAIELSKLMQEHDDLWEIQLQEAIDNSIGIQPKTLKQLASEDYDETQYSDTQYSDFEDAPLPTMPAMPAMTTRTTLPTMPTLPTLPRDQGGPSSTKGNKNTTAAKGGKAAKGATAAKSTGAKAAKGGKSPGAKADQADTFKIIRVHTHEKKDTHKSAAQLKRELAANAAAKRVAIQLQPDNQLNNPSFQFSFNAAKAFLKNQDDGTNTQRPNKKIKRI